MFREVAVLIAIAKPVKKSLVNNNHLSTLPRALRLKVIAVLEFLQTEGIHQVVDMSSRSTTNATLSHGGGFIRMDAFLRKHPSRISEITEALQLLVWFVEPKFHGNFEGKSAKSCNSCGQETPISAELCSDARCHSHTLWKLIAPVCPAKKTRAHKKKAGNI